MAFFGRHQQIAEGFLLRIHLLSGLYGSWSRKGDSGIADQGTDAARRARMQRQGHGPRALWSQPVSADGNKKNQIASRFDFFCSYYLFSNLVRRYLTFVATALSNVRRDGII